MAKAAAAWTCIVCGHGHDAPPERITRESAPCTACGSTLRNRATVLALVYGLKHWPRTIADLPEDWSRRGVGLSDHHATAARLPSRLSYTNTYLHRYPRLDILDPPQDLRGELEFIICSDVLEHVEPPYERAYAGLRDVLREDGFAVVTVPVRDVSRTLEYYPGLQEYEVLDGPAVRWRDADGREHLDESPEMHLGEGLVLAFRAFSPVEEAERLREAGFGTVWEVPPHPEWGVFPVGGPGLGVFLARRETLT